MDLPARLLAIHDGLDAAGIEHAFGGAIALAYWTLEPRGTRDIDVNVFTTTDALDTVLAALPDGVGHDDADRAAILRDGQRRLWWDDTPVDVFFDYAPVHADAAAHRAIVPFAGREIPVLGPVELAVFKAMFDRTKDWADIEAMLAAGTVQAADIRAALAPMLGSDDARWARLDEAQHRSAHGESH